MATVVDLRLRRLERQIPSPVERELASMSDEELTAELLCIERAILADPTSSDYSRRHTAALLALPWHLPTKQWSVAQKVAWCAEAHWVPSD